MKDKTNVYVKKREGGGGGREETFVGLRQMDLRCRCCLCFIMIFGFLPIFLAETWSELNPVVTDAQSDNGNDSETPTEANNTQNTKNLC